MPVIRWWVVASPKRWTWAQLFETGRIRFELGKLSRHFGRLRVDDLVVGYESSPRRAIVAVARVSKEFGVHEDGTPAAFELVPGWLFSEGVGYERLHADPLLRASEPMRNRNQGTLFALTEAESQRLLSFLEQDGAAMRWIQAQTAD